MNFTEFKLSADFYISRENDRCIARAHDEEYRKYEMSLFQDIIGNFIAVKCRHDGDTRVFIYNEGINDELSKDGWFNTFTISDEPMKKGIWIVKFKEAVYDVNWHLNFHVHPRKFIGDTEERVFANKGWQYFADKNILNMVNTGLCVNSNEFAVFEQFGTELEFDMGDRKDTMFKYNTCYKDVFPLRLFNMVLDDTNPINIEMVGDAYNTQLDCDAAKDMIINIHNNQNVLYPGITSTKMDTLIMIISDVIIDNYYATCEDIIEMVEDKCAKRLSDKENAKQKKSETKKMMSSYHKEIKKIAAAHLNKKYEPSSMEAYSVALNKARSACKKGSPDIEDIMNELRTAAKKLSE